jgi:hypothetical protein
MYRDGDWDDEFQEELAREYWEREMTDLTILILEDDLGSSGLAFFR